jgi:tetrahedral aminopeptidase
MSESKSTKSGAPSIGAEQISLLEKLCNANAVAGEEGEIRKIVLDEVRPFAADCRIDTMGNVLVTCPSPAPNAMRVMLAAHMDEVGFMIVDEDEGGLYKFEIVGGIDARQLVGKSVTVGKQRLPGVIGAAPIHLTTPDERKKTLAVDALRIDLGTGGAGKVKVGDRATFGTTFLQTGPSLRAKALDDRLGVAILIELVKHPPANIQLLAAFTVQEEVGLRGAHVAAYAMDPQIGIAVDSVPSNDLPMWDGSENARYNTRLDCGPVIYVVDGLTINDPRLIGHFSRTGDELQIPYQLRQPGPGGTDAGAIHLQRSGIPSVSISVPGRYAHSAVGLARLEDWENTLRLLFEGLGRLTTAVLDR